MNIMQINNEKGVQTHEKEKNEMTERTSQKVPIALESNLKVITSCNKYIACFHPDYSFRKFQPHLTEIIDFLLLHLNNNTEIETSLVFFKERNTAYRAPEVLVAYCKTIGIVGLLNLVKLNHEQLLRAFFFTKTYDPVYKDRTNLMPEEKDNDKRMKQTRDTTRKKNTGTAAREAYDLKRTGKIYQNMHMMTPNHKKMVNSQEGARKIVTVRRRPKKIPDNHFWDESLKKLIYCFGCEHNEPNQMGHACMGYD